MNLLLKKYVIVLIVTFIDLRAKGTVAFFERQGIPEELVKAVAGDSFDDFDIREAVGRLISFSFLQRQNSGDDEASSYELHRLVQLVTVLSLGMYCFISAVRYVVNEIIIFGTNVSCLNDDFLSSPFKDKFFP
jgi:hypothetical protein